MQSKTNFKPMMPFVSAGLLVIAATWILNRYLTLPDFAMGGLMGVGIGLELVPLFKIKRIDKTNC